MSAFRALNQLKAQEVRGSVEAPRAINPQMLGLSSYSPVYGNTMLGPNFQNPQMGSWFSDLIGIDVDLGSSVEDICRSLGLEFLNIFTAIGKILVNVDWRKISHIFLVEMNPIHLSYQATATNPVTEHLHRELDKLSGGTLTSLDQLFTLPGRSLRGDAISKEELVENAIFAAKLAAIVATGGSAASIIGFSSSQMKKGYLGQTPLGGAILTIVTVAAVAYAADEAIFDAAGREATKQALNAGGQELIKQNPELQSDLGTFLVAGAAAGTGAGVWGDDVGATLVSHTEESGKNLAKEELGQEMNFPGGKQLANTIVDRSYPPSYEAAVDEGEKQGFSFDQIIQGLKNFNLNAPSLNLPKFDIDPSAPGLNLPSQGAGSPSVAMPELNIPAIHAPNITVPGSLEGWIDLACKAYLVVSGKNVCARYKKRVRVGGKWLYVYVLEDGSLYWSWEDLIIDRTSEYLLWGMLIAGAVLALDLLGSKRRTA